MAFKFEKLRVWQQSIDLSKRASEMVSKFPKQEMFVLTSQMQRAADSVSLNIAEGSTGQTDREQKRFLGIALRSALEVVCCLFVAKARNLITESERVELYDFLTKLIIDIQALRNSI